MSLMYGCWGGHSAESGSGRLRMREGKGRVGAGGEREEPQREGATSLGDSSPGQSRAWGTIRQVL